MSEKNEYIPGVCNIGGAEAENRLKTAKVSGVITLVAWALLLAIQAPALTFALLALPAFTAATAYIQSKQRFCAGFGAEGLYNFSDTVGNFKKASKASDRAKDKKKAINITIKAAIIGIVVAAIAALSAFVLY